MSGSPLVAVIVLNWNNGPDSLSCVDSCRKLDWPNLRIIVVDNGSNDGSTEMLKQRCPDLELIETGANLGFAGGNNAGIRHAMAQGAEYVWLLNNDAVAAPDALSTLVKALSDRGDAGIAGSMIYYRDDPRRIWFAGGIWKKGRLRLRQRGANRLDDGQFDEQRELGSVSGCSMLVRASVINEIGPLDESYFLYWEDTDFCARAAQHGYKTLFAPASHVWHKVSATVATHSEMQYYYNTRNGLFFCGRYDWIALPCFLAFVAADVIVGALRGNRAMLRGFLKGMAGFIRGERGRGARY